MIKSTFNLIIQIVLVVAGVILFAYFDPFGIFVRTKKKLQDTPITVVSIKQIGQLITAEYYGEVLSSLQEEMTVELIVNKQHFVNQVDSLNLRYIQALRNFYAVKDSVKVRFFWKRKDLREYFYGANASLVNHNYYPDMIKQILAKHSKYDNDEGELLLAIRNWRTNMDQNALQLELEKFKVDSKKVEAAKDQELAKLSKSKAFKKRQLIALGRGWVKAGIDFSNFTEQNFRYDKGRKTIYLFGMEPRILDSVINPWFNAKEKIKGFEIIAATDRAKDPEYLAKVKQSCLNKLVVQAEKAGIIEQAKLNAEESLKQFFSLLLNEPLDKVMIMSNSLDEYAKKLIDGRPIFLRERLSLIDTTLHYLDNLDSITAVNTIAKLYKLKFIISTDTFPLNRFSAFSSRVVEDNLITPEEWQELNKAFKDTTLTHLDSLWYFPYNNYNFICQKAKDEAREKNNYLAQGTGQWLDSVRNKNEFSTYKETIRLLRIQGIKAEINSKHNRAVKESVALMRKYIKAIMINDQTDINDTLQVKAQLDKLQLSAIH